MYLDAGGPRAPRRFQWEANSGTFSNSQSNNCGPTVATLIAQFYRDHWFGIEATRRLGAAPGLPTSAWQQAEMLRGRGVECDVVEIESMAQIHNLVGSSRRPILLGILMARVPAAVRDHAFLGWHAVAVLDPRTVGESPGVQVDDPNFWPQNGPRPDPDNGRKFYADTVLRWAVIENSPRWAVVPRNVKAIPESADFVIVEPGAKVRSTPRIGAHNITRIMRDAHHAIRIRARRGGEYRYWNGRRWEAGHRWVLVRLPNGDRGWVRRPDVHAAAARAMAATNRSDQAAADEILAGSRIVPQAEAETFVLDPVTLEVDRAIDPTTWPAGPDIEEDPAP